METQAGAPRLEDQVKQAIVGDLHLKRVKAEDVGDNDPLFGGGIGLDSLDAMELTVVLKRRFGTTFKNRNEARDAMATVATLADYIRRNRPPPPAG
jgi:acyl carrier protein